MLLFFCWISRLWADPNIVSLGKIGGSDLKAVLPSEKALIVLGISIQIIWALLSYIFKHKEKQMDQSEKKLDRLYAMVHEIQGHIKELRMAPSEDEMIIKLQPHVELAVLRAMKKHEMD